MIPFLLALVLCCDPPIPPALSAVVEGVVRQAEGGDAVPDAAVALLGDPGVEHRTVTDQAGRFRLVGVEPGGYRLRVRATGYQEWTEALHVPSGGTGEVRVRLRRTTVVLDPFTVAGVPGVRASETEFGVRIDAAALESLPAPYEPTRAVGFAPGVSPGRLWGGAEDQANVYQVDGLAQTHPGEGGPLFSLSPAWVEAVELRGIGTGASEGGFQGGVVNVLTRSGGDELQGRLWASGEAHPLNATNILEGEVGRERASRREVEAAAEGPILAGTLNFFAGAHLLQEAFRAQSRLPEHDTRFLPFREERLELRGFGKLTWRATAADRLELSAAHQSSRVDGWGQNGYLARGAAGRMEAPGGFWSASWTRALDSGGRLRLEASRSRARERLRPPAGSDVPAARIYTLGEPVAPTYHNPEFQVERRPETRMLALRGAVPFGTGPATHQLQWGVELARSRWDHLRRRTGGFTWRPVRSSHLDPDDPSTWASSNIVPTSWGGEVDLHSRMGSETAYLEDRLELHPRLRLTPGLRWTRWRGDLVPGGREADRFRAVSTSGWSPRLGAVYRVPGVGDLRLKGHWGRYHQNLLSRFFERTEGGQVFSDRENWYLHGTVPATPDEVITRQQRDALADAGRFELADVLRLTETGPVFADYRQPYVDQWVVGLEKVFGSRLRLEAVWVDRRNRNMVGLRDRNMQTNYWRLENIRVLDGRGDPLLLGGEPMTIPEMYIPHEFLRRQVRHVVEDDAGFALPPGVEPADTVHMTWDPDLHLENLPDARRRTRQLQLAAHVTGDDWGGSLSLVYTRITGNMHSVTGYPAGTGFQEAWELGAGPWVRPNERVNFQGRLPGASPLELKVLLHGELPLAFRGGGFLRVARGERFTPYFRLTPYRLQYESAEDGHPLEPRYLHPVLGQRVFMDKRGSARYADRFTLDLRLERTLPLGEGRWTLTADLFNVWNAKTPTDITAAVNYPTTLVGGTLSHVDASAVFGAVWERVPPRALRLGLEARF